MLAATKLLSRQRFCRNKHNFVATKDVFCRDKQDKSKLVVTKLLSRKAYFCCNKKWYLWQLPPMIVTGTASSTASWTLWGGRCLSPKCCRLLDVIGSRYVNLWRRQDNAGRLTYTHWCNFWLLDIIRWLLSQWNGWCCSRIFQGSRVLPIMNMMLAIALFSGVVHCYLTSIHDVGGWIFVVSDLEHIGSCISEGGLSCGWNF